MAKQDKCDKKGMHITSLPMLYLILDRPKDSTIPKYKRIEKANIKYKHLSLSFKEEGRKGRLGF